MQTNDWKLRLIAHAANMFGNPAVPEQVYLAPLHTKIGKPALKNDFL